MIRSWPPARAVLLYGTLALLAAAVLALAWLRWDAGRGREAWFDERSGRLASARVADSAHIAQGELLAESVVLRANTGLEARFRVIRREEAGPRPVLVLLGGHRTGSDAIELFDDIGERAVVALDYPYGGPDRVRGFGEFLSIVPQVRQAFLDLPPAISLTIDWLEEQPWARPEEIVMAGVSLGVPFAATAAARDERLRGLLLVHGAADNRLWLEQNLARQVEADWLRPSAATLLHWLAYGPQFDTVERVAAVSPRPVIVVGARDDERTPEAQTQRLFEAAREPKRLRWTEGGHVGPGRADIIDDLVRIVDEEWPVVAVEPVEDGRATPAGAQP